MIFLLIQRTLERGRGGAGALQIFIDQGFQRESAKFALSSEKRGSSPLLGTLCAHEPPPTSNILSVCGREDGGLRWGGGGLRGSDDCMNYPRASGGKLLFLIGSQIQISHFKQMGKINVIKSGNLAAVLVPLHFPLLFKLLVSEKRRRRKKKRWLR